jgi:hypothetical protein
LERPLHVGEPCQITHRAARATAEAERSPRHGQAELLSKGECLFRGANCRLIRTRGVLQAGKPCESGDELRPWGRLEQCNRPLGRCQCFRRTEPPADVREQGECLAGADQVTLSLEAGRRPLDCLCTLAHHPCLVRGISPAQQDQGECPVGFGDERPGPLEEGEGLRRVEAERPLAGQECVPCGSRRDVGMERRVTLYFCQLECLASVLGEYLRQVLHPPRRLVLEPGRGLDVPGRALCPRNLFVGNIAHE